MPMLCFQDITRETRLLVGVERISFWTMATERRLRVAAKMTAARVAFLTFVLVC